MLWWIFSVIADDDTLFLVAQSELAAIELQGQITPPALVQKLLPDKRIE